MNYKEILDKIKLVLKGNPHLEELSDQNNNPFKILISTILSARTRDTNTRKVTKRLFERFKSPEEIAKADVNLLEEMVYETGFYRVKATRIKEVSQILVDKYNGKVPNTFDELKELPGVGRKTANCVLNYAFKIPAICVDTHVHRISNRLGWVHTKTPKKTEKALKETIPKDQWIRINRIFVKFGQQICLPNNPKHDLCPIETQCPKDFRMERKKKKEKKT